MLFFCTLYMIYVRELESQQVKVVSDRDLFLQLSKGQWYQNFNGIKPCIQHESSIVQIDLGHVTVFKFEEKKNWRNDTNREIFDGIGIDPELFEPIL